MVSNFVSNAGPQQAFSVDASYLVGSNPMALTVTRSVVGILPECYLSVVVDCGRSNDRITRAEEFDNRKAILHSRCIDFGRRREQLSRFGT